MQKASSSSVRVFYPKFDKENLLNTLSQRLRVLNKEIPLIKVILFGSYAKGNYTVSSDIDLLVVYSGKTRADAYAIVKKTIAIPRLEPHIYSEEEYMAMKETINKMVGSGIVLLQ